MSEYTLGPITESDRTAIVDLFNFYVKHSFAAYPEEPVPYEFFALLMQSCSRYPCVTVKDGTGTLLGFGMLRAHNPMPAFSHTAEITCFIAPDRTGRGLGSKMLEYLEREGKKRDLSCILASISSLNDGSIRFHERHGFERCGIFRGVGRKKGRIFDTVWMQKNI
jgi:L-amino acid N-acyltransferase YncA